MKKISYILTLLLFMSAVGFSSPLHAAKKRTFSSEAEADCYLNKHFEKGQNYYNNHEWRNASREFEKIIYFFPDSETAANVYFYLGVCFYERKEYDFANEAFTSHLKASAQPVYFEDALQYKFAIAEHFRVGQKRRPLLFPYFPKFWCGKSLALAIYDDIVLALPNHDLAVDALFCKAQLLDSLGEYRESIDAYQVLIRRFPRHQIVPQCYVNMAEIYCKLSLVEFQNPDILALAQLNAQRFSIDYPRDDRLDVAFGYVEKIKELYARGLCDLGLFYERTGHSDASAIYYQSSIEEFPDTEVAKFCRYRLKELDKFQEEEPSGDSLLFSEEPQKEECTPSIDKVDAESAEDVNALLSAHNQAVLKHTLLCKRKIRYYIPETEGKPVTYDWDDIYCYPEFEMETAEDQKEENSDEDYPRIHYSLLKKSEVQKRTLTPTEECEENDSKSE